MIKMLKLPFKKYRSISYNTETHVFGIENNEFMFIHWIKCFFHYPWSILDVIHNDMVMNRVDFNVKDIVWTKFSPK